MHIVDVWLLKLLAQVPPGNLDSLPQVSLSGGKDDSTFERGLTMVFGVAGGAALILLSYACLRYVLSRGDPEATMRARNTIIDTLIGLAVIVGAFGIITFVIGFISP